MKWKMPWKIFPRMNQYMTMMKRYIEIDEEDDLRREFDEMVARGRIKSKSFDSWMRNVNHYRYDEKEGKYYNIEQE